jgi:hydroxymethylglutaryl-CoA reductase (NADPH)
LAQRLVDSLGVLKRRGVPESLVGAVAVPLAVAGPIPICGEYASGSYQIPLATTEQTLVAAVNRGAKVIREVGGCACRVFYDGIVRAPAFSFRDVIEAVQALRWIETHNEALVRAAEEVSRFTKLVNVKAVPAGSILFVRLTFQTGDAMGMSMATRAAERAATVIVKNTNACLVTISGNLCSDKKPSFGTELLGKGKGVVAEVRLSPEALRGVLRVEGRDLERLNTTKNLLGSGRGGLVGQNAHHANMVAALFIATGQDPGHIVEGSLGTTFVMEDQGAAVVSVTLPALCVGTVGGGTELPHQRECLDFLGVAGSGRPPGTHAKALAEIAAAVVLAGEVSLLAALATGEFTEAHMRLTSQG